MCPQLHVGSITLIVIVVIVDRPSGFSGVLFSWISVWLPEEFIEGRIFVALTVFLTLSAESNAAKEILPRVSYVKAIDVWFGFTAIFIFATMLQALAVISLEHMSKKMVNCLLG